MSAVDDAMARMRAWASRHGEADTQGLIAEEWEGLARAAMGWPDELVECFVCHDEAYPDTLWRFVHVSAGVVEHPVLGIHDRGLTSAGVVYAHTDRHSVPEIQEAALRLSRRVTP